MYEFARYDQRCELEIYVQLLQFAQPLLGQLPTYAHAKYAVLTLCFVIGSSHFGMRQQFRLEYELCELLNLLYLQIGRLDHLSDKHQFADHSYLNQHLPLRLLARSKLRLQMYGCALVIQSLARVVLDAHRLQILI